MPKFAKKFYWYFFVLFLWMGIFFDVAGAQEANYLQSLSDAKLTYVQTLLNRVTELYPTSDWTKKGVLQRFCKAIYDSDVLKMWFINHDSSYDALYRPDQSLFLLSVCSAVGDSTQAADPAIKDLIKTLKWQNLSPSYSSNCSVDWDMNGCAFQNLFPEVFASIINEYSNIKVAGVYGYRGDSTPDALKQFSDKYFGVNVCPNNVIYLSQSYQTDISTNECGHPQTAATLAQYIRQAKSLISSTIILDAKKLVAASSQQDCNSVVPGYVPLLCAFMISSNQQNAFENLIYNELLYFQLMVGIVGSIFASDGSYVPTKYQSISDVKRSSLKADAFALQDELQLSIQAVKQTNRMITSIQNSFPLHIWLLAYYEDLQQFVQRFSHIYTPIHQLYYTLQNVQAP